MKKVQLPVIGGIRKVIQPGSNTAGGTTIAEIGNSTVTLEQLAALIFNLLTNTGTVNTAAAAPGVLVPGAGLGGGGVLTGSVPIYLTAPIPALLAEDGQDGDVGPPGPRGAQGVPGIPGAFLLAEDGADGDIGPPGLPGAQGVMGSQGPQGIPGTSGTGSSTGLVVFVPEDPSDNDTGFLVPGPVGPQGPQGVQGSQGAAGTGSGGASTGPQMWVPEDTSYDDVVNVSIPVSHGSITVQGVASILSTIQVGTTGLANATIYFPGNTPQIIASATGAVLQILSNATGSIQLGVQNAQNVIVNSNGRTAFSNTISGGSQVFINPGAVAVAGLITQAGNSSSNFNSQWLMATGFYTMQLFGDGGLTVGPSTLFVASGPADIGLGTVNVWKNYYVNGVPVIQAGMAVPGDRLHMIPEDPYWEEEIYRGPVNGARNFTGQIVIDNNLSNVGPVLVVRGGNGSTTINTGFQVNIDGSSVWGAAGALQVAGGNGLVIATASPLGTSRTQIQTGMANFTTTITTRTSNALTVDPFLEVTCNETGTYKFELVFGIYEDVLGTGGFNFDMNGGAAVLSRFFMTGFLGDGINPTPTFFSTTTQTGNLSIGTITTVGHSGGLFEGSLSVSTTGSFGMRWAQTSTLAGNPTHLTSGSSITLTKIG